MRVAREAPLKLVMQLDMVDCGPACMSTIAGYYGIPRHLRSMGRLCSLSRTGTSLLGLAKGAKSLGIKTQAVRVSYDYLESTATLPCIAYWKKEHYVVVYKIRKYSIYVADPAFGLLRFSKKEFMKNWANDADMAKGLGICLLISPPSNSYKNGSRLKSSCYASFPRYQTVKGFMEVAQETRWQP